MLSGAAIVIITAPKFFTRIKTGEYLSNYLVTPMLLSTKDVTEGSKIIYAEGNPFGSYLKHIKKFNFIITDSNTKKIQAASKYGVPPNVYFKKDGLVTNKAGQEIGNSYVIDKGTLFFLPPVTEISTQEGINKIIECLQDSKIEKIESAPEWIKNVKLSGFDEINKKIKNLESQKSKLETQILEENTKKNIFENFYSLLFAQNQQLEESVKTAFELLGFNEIKRIRNDNDEDWVIDFTTVDGVDHGIIEVKGRNEKTTQGDIVQCNKWVDDYHLMKPPKNTKGIFISNQFRLKSYPESKDERTKFEPNELSYANGREICIIPTFVLFEAVNKALSGKKKTREEIEKLIYETNGILLNL